VCSPSLGLSASWLQSWRLGRAPAALSHIDTGEPWRGSLGLAKRLSVCRLQLLDVVAFGRRSGFPPRLARQFQGMSGPCEFVCECRRSTE
jgi:hypothetical protein